MLLAAALFLLAGHAAAGPEVVRVRIPAKDVTRYFPPGTELRVLSPQEFESRVEAAQRGPAGGRPAAAPRLIRARHRARWESGLLRGRSELVVSAGPTGPVEFPLEPWTPAILRDPKSAPIVSARDTGSAVMRLDASSLTRPAPLEWEQQPRPRSRGRAFSLGLPAEDTTVLELELPKGWSASSQRGIRRGPIPTEDPAWSLWEVDGEAGRFDLELRDAADRGGAAIGARAWMSSSTQVDLRRSADPAGGIRNWTAECRLDLDPRHAGRLEVELDPGMELVDVRGEAVQGYRTENAGDRSRVTVTIAEGVRSTTVRFLAHARVPSEGAWPIPALRPLDAVWTGGRTTVILDAQHVVSEYRERAGRLVPPGRGESGAGHRLTFEAASPRSVAELVFIRPRAELACTVRGQLILGGAPARLDCRLDWTLQRGSVSQIEVDLTPGWVPDQVQIRGMDEPLAWHSSILASGATRLRIMLPASLLARRGWTVTLGATSGAPTLRGPLELPRVHPVGAAVLDEAWLAWGDDRTIIQPTRAEGLAWIDPDEVPGLRADPPSPGLRQALAWRWTADRADARIDRERIEPEPRASIRTRARVSPDGRELSVEGTIVVASGAAPLESLPIGVIAPGDPLASWRFTDESGERPLRPIDGPGRARLELPGDASERALTLHLPAGAEKTVSFRAVLPWSSPGLIPLPFVPPTYLEQATVLVETPAGMKVRPRPDGLGRLHPSAIGTPKPGRIPDELVAPEGGSPRDRIVHAYTYTEPGARLEFATESMDPLPLPGIVREASLTTSLDPRGRMLNRLRLVAQVEASESFELELPAGATLVRGRRDGAAFAPIRSGSRLSIPATATGHGTRTSTIVLDYLMEAAPVGDGSVLRPDPPRLELPCLSFIWEIIAPPGWQVLDPGPGLVANDPGDPSEWPCVPLGIRAPVWPLAADLGAAGTAERLRQLDERLSPSAPDEISLAECFIRWDAGPWPVVIDQLALSSAGLGPRSPCSLGRSTADSRDRAQALLQRHGLAVVSFPDALLITTEAERLRFERRAPWLEAVAEAMAWGSDRTDRLQTVGHWRGDSVPRSLPGADEANEQNHPLPGRITRRFSAPGWPGPDAFVHLVDGRRRMLSAWLVAGLLVIGWLAASRWATVRWLIAPALAVAACVLLERILPARHGALLAGVFVGSLTALIIELARASRRVPAHPPAPARTESSLVRGAARAAAGTASLLVLAATIGAWRTAPAGSEPPIVALFPYEGTFDPTQRPDRVILRLEDFHRLAPRSDGAGTPRPAVAALSADHRVSRRTGEEILVESEIELEARGRGPFAWRIPVSSARDISAALDGRSVPIAVRPGGEAATIAIPGEGRHRLSIRRWTAARREEAGVEAINLPVNAMPAARLAVEPPADDLPQGLAVTRGRIERMDDGSLAGRLGPSDRIIVRWTRPGRDAAEHRTGPVEGLILWDVTPAGDVVRARLTYHGSEDIAAIRLAHDKGLVLRSVRPPGPSRVYSEDDAAKGQWLLTFDPPLPPDSALSVACWRPLPDAAGAPGRPGAGPAPRGRHLPGIRPVAAERFTGALGVRRPGDWTGRLAPLPDTDPIDDEAFVKAWGRLPDESLTLSGTTRFRDDLAAVLDTGPAPPRILVRPTLNLQPESGRIVVAAEADLLEVSGHDPILDAELPEGMHLTQVSGEGLIGWVLREDRRLRLIWQRWESGRRRHLRIRGWIPIASDPLRIGPRVQRARTPWIGWPGTDDGPGWLTISGGAQAEIVGGAGLTPAPQPESSLSVGARLAAVLAGGPTEALASPRQSYRVDDPGRLGEITWDTRLPRVAVVVESQLTIHPDFARWVAVIRYDIIGGGLDRMNLRIPAPWSARADLSLPGEDPPQPQVIGPSSFWSITPRRPLWGSHRLVLRSTLDLGSSREISQPEVAPLGRGSVDAYLGIVNATGRPLDAADTAGLQAIPYASRFRDETFAHGGGTPAGAYRVTRKSWALRVQLPRGGPVPGDRDDDGARVSLADLTLSVTPDRWVVGRALYEIVPDSGRLLTIQFPDGSTILSAAVEPNPTVPLRAGPSAWSIVLEPGRPGRVCVIWKSPPPALSTAQQLGWPVALPRAGLGPARTLVSVSLPSGVVLEAIPAGFESVTMARLIKARADWLGQSIRDSLAKLDRSSGRDHQRLVSMLVQQELELRAADRAARRRPSLPPASAEERDLTESTAITRNELIGAVRAAGFSDDLASAQGYLGEARIAAIRPPGGIPEPVAPCGIRAFGHPTAMSGVAQGLDVRSAPPGLLLAGAARDEWESGGTTRSAILGAALAVGLIIATVFRGQRSSIAAAISLVVMLMIAALAGGPTMLVGGLAFAAFGWKAVPSR